MLDELKDVLRKYKINREDIMNIKQFSPGMCVSSEEASDVIKENKDFMCIAEGKPRNVEIGNLQNIMQLESAYHTNKKKRTALKEDIDSIQKRVKWVLGVIVGLLKDRITVDDSLLVRGPESKKFP
ncbi:hypothetical protein F8M41_023247 [Gigaspora margarita]|uniref:Uncharacterized protein n=1 Tax=Gigaspora margarita TaxID=4874 RepID=A0A8H4ADR8_GIGMA|nr:hypothetical protein F8M41_023247 [Gigaspora margarita]